MKSAPIRRSATLHLHKTLYHHRVILALVAVQGQGLGAALLPSCETSCCCSHTVFCLLQSDKILLRIITKAGILLDLLQCVHQPVYLLK